MTLNLSHLGLQAFLRSVPSASRELVSQAVLDTLQVTEPIDPQTFYGDAFLRSPSAFHVIRRLAGSAERLLEGLRVDVGLPRLLWANQVEPLPEILGDRASLSRLRSYQRGMLEALGEDILQGVSPRLGLAAPMQTGKSFLIPQIIHLIDELLGRDTRYVVLSSARIITSQVLEDLVGTFPDVGRYDGLVKEPRRITVGSFYTLSRPEHLESFPWSAERRVLIMDQAVYTQTPGVRRILDHLEATKQSPLVVGLSGTAGGLKGYHVSDYLDLPTALEKGWIRTMEAEQVFPLIETQAMKSASERMIWWRATQKNARFLGDVYGERIHGRYEKNLVYVPTIRHGELLKEDLVRRYGEGNVHFLHHGHSPQEIKDTLAAWQEGKGVLISIRMLSHGFRGRGIGAVFHTYQTTSEELFSERTGRAWGIDGAEGLAALFVLEATWDKSGRFSNLARLLGLVDYPRKKFVVDGHLVQEVRKIRESRELEEELQEGIARGEISDYFKDVPVLPEWRKKMAEILEAAGGIAALSEETKLPREIIAGFAVGALPTLQEQISGLSCRLGGETEALAFWIRVWERVIDEVVEGLRKAPGDIEEKLFQWRGLQESLEARADLLDGILRQWFPPYEEGEPKIHFERMALSYQKALRAASVDDERNGEPPSSDKVTAIAYRNYNAGLRPEERPSLRFFASRASLTRDAPDIRAFYDATRIIERREAKEALIPDLLRAAVEQAKQQVGDPGQGFSDPQFMDILYDLYCEQLSPVMHPPPELFESLVVRTDPEIREAYQRAFETARAEDKERKKLEKEDQQKRLLASFRHVLHALEKSGEILSPRSIYHRAYHVRRADGDLLVGLSYNSFLDIIRGNEELENLLSASPAVKKSHKIDDERGRQAVSRAIVHVRERGFSLESKWVQEMSHDIYCKDLPPDHQPSRSFFFRWMKKASLGQSG